MQKVMLQLFVLNEINYYESDFLYMSKGEAINLLRNADLIEVWQF